MKVFNRKKGNSLIEYALILVFAGIFMTYLFLVPASKNDGRYTSREVYVNYFKNSFGGSANSGNSAIVIAPLGD